MNTTTAKPINLAKYNGYITVTNPETGEHRTFRIRTYTKGNLKGRRAVGLLYGPDNTTQYRDFGFVNPDGRIYVWKRFRDTVYEKLANVLNFAGWFAEHKNIQFDSSIKCRRCNRDLTDPESIELGIGPVCRGDQ